jgi:hypothetical protein
MMLLLWFADAARASVLGLALVALHAGDRLRAHRGAVLALVLALALALGAPARRAEPCLPGAANCGRAMRACMGFTRVLEAARLAPVDAPPTRAECEAVVCRALCACCGGGERK